MVIKNKTIFDGQEVKKSIIEDNQMNFYKRILIVVFFLVIGVLITIFSNKEDNTNSYTMRYYVTSMDHTLSSEEIESFHKNVIETFAKKNINLKQ